VSALRLPKMSGLELLAIVEKRWPSAVRIVLSGQVNERAFVESSGVAHQFLPKPVDPEALKRTIDRASALRQWATRPEIASEVARIGRLPPLPQVYRELTAAVQREESLAEIGRIIARDPSLTARLLQVVNSAYFSPRRPITSAELATSFLGLDMLRPLVIFQGMTDGSATDPVVEQRIQTTWERSMDVACAARRIALFEKLPPHEAASAFSLGVLHNLGQLLLARYHDPIEIGDSQHAADEVERKRYGVAHTEVGALVLLTWGLPDEVVEVAAWHHDPSRLASTGKLTPGLLVSAASAIKDSEAPGGDSLAGTRLEKALAAGGFVDRLEAWRGIAERAGDASKESGKS
jgi:HD-like signal output (HDOD) protein